MTEIQKTLPIKKILVVEDDSSTQRLMMYLLESLGYSVVITNNGWEALDKVQNEIPAAILMDISMPELDGFAATVLMREIFTASDFPIIACTSDRVFKQKKRAFEFGMNDWISKPISRDRLRIILNKWLGDVNQKRQETGKESELLDCLPTHDMRVMELVFPTRASSDMKILRNQVLSEFLYCTPKLLASISNSRQEINLSGTIEDVRRLKRLSATIGAVRMSRLCHYIEKSIVDNKNGEQQGLCSETKTEFLKLKTILQKRYWIS